MNIPVIWPLLKLEVDIWCIFGIIVVDGLILVSGVLPDGVAVEPVSGKSCCNKTCCTQFMNRSCNVAANNAIKRTLLLSFLTEVQLRFPQVITVRFLQVMYLIIPLPMLLSIYIY